MRATTWNWLALGLALLPGLAAAAEPEPVPVYREIKDWIVGCDNTRFCTAVLADHPERMRVGMLVQREAGAWGNLHLTLVGSTDWSGEPMLDGQLLVAPWRMTRGVETSLELEGADAYAVLRQLRNGQRLVDDTRPGGRVSSLQGLSAALLLMDAVQGRVGHYSALIRPGDSVADAQLPTPAKPQVPAFVAATALGAQEQAGITQVVMAKAAAENQLINEYDVAPKLELHALDDQHALALLSYNCNDFHCLYALYKVSREAPYTLGPLEFEAPSSPVVISRMRDAIDFYPGKGELHSYAKDDYPGSCGVEESWRYDGMRMRLLRLSRMDRCAEVGTDSWPVLWRSEG